jgi:hypothetical protein
MDRVSPTVWLAALSAVLIGAALAHDIPACVFGSHTGFSYVELTPGSCAFTSLNWLRWTVFLAGAAAAVLVVAVGWRRGRRSATETPTPQGHHPLSPRASMAVAVLAAALLVALLIPSAPLIHRPARYVQGIPVPTDYRIPLRIAVFAVGAFLAMVLAINRFQGRGSAHP